MQGSLLRFYMHEGDRHHGTLVWEWLLQKANKLGIRGGSAFKALAGFGRHHALHEDRFFELAGTLSVQVEFVVTEDESRQLIELVDQEQLKLFYTQMPAQFGMTNANG